MPVNTLTVEVAATSQTSPDEAIRKAISRARTRFSEVLEVKVGRVQIILRHEEVVGYRVTLKVTTHADESGARADYLRTPDVESLAERGSAQWLPRPTAARLLRTGSDGAARIGGTRVTLDSVIAAFSSGASPETIAEQYPSLKLADVYRVLGYYLQNQDEVDTYIAEREYEADKLREEIEGEIPSTDLRARLLSRRSSG